MAFNVGDVLRCVRPNRDDQIPGDPRTIVRPGDLVTITHIMPGRPALFKLGERGNWWFREADFEIHALAAPKHTVYVAIALPTVRLDNANRNDFLTAYTSTSEEGHNQLVQALTGMRYTVVAAKKFTFTLNYPPQEVAVPVPAVNQVVNEVEEDDFPMWNEDDLDLDIDLDNEEQDGQGF